MSRSTERWHPNLDGMGLPKALTDSIRTAYDLIYSIRDTAQDIQALSILENTHAQRLSNFPPAKYPLGSLFIETDRGNVVYQNQTISNAPAWVYVAGIMQAAFSKRPSDLGINDTGFIFYATDSRIAYRWNGSAWVVMFTPNLEAVHADRYSIGTVNTTGTAVTWVSGPKFRLNWLGSKIAISGILYTIATFTDSQHLVLASTAGVQAAVPYIFTLYSPVSYADGAMLFETDRRILYIAEDATGTVNTSGTGVTWVSGPKFDPYWAGSQITINGVTYTWSAFSDSTHGTLTATAGVQAAAAYSVISGVWAYVSGSYDDVLANIPTDLIFQDSGFLFGATDYLHSFLWTGATTLAFNFAPGDPGSLYIAAGINVPPNGGLWHACDGTAVSVSQGDGTTTPITTPDLTTGVFIRGGGYSGTPSPAAAPTWAGGAKTDDESTHTHSVPDQNTADESSHIHGISPVSSGSSNAGAGAPIGFITSVPGTTQAGSAHHHDVPSQSTLAGTAHHHALSNANAALNIPSDGTGGLPLNIKLGWYIRR